MLGAVGSAGVGHSDGSVAAVLKSWIRVGPVIYCNGTGSVCGGSGVIEWAGR